MGWATRPPHPLGREPTERPRRWKDTRSAGCCDVGVDDDSDGFLTISLAESHQENDACYKLAAAVLEVEAG